jgi:hypothetical protein
MLCLLYGKYVWSWRNPMSNALQALTVVAGFGGLLGVGLAVLVASSVPNVCRAVIEQTVLGGSAVVGYDCFGIGTATQIQWATILGGIGALISMGAIKVWNSRTTT